MDLLDTSLLKPDPPIIIVINRLLQMGFKHWEQAHYVIKVILSES